MAEWIKPGTNFDWIGNRTKFYTFSITMCLLAIAMMLVNFFWRGQPLNFSTDFKGGSEIMVVFSRDVDPHQVRQAMDKGGFKGAEVVKMQGNSQPNTFLLRVSEVTAFSVEEQNRIKGIVDQTVGAGNLTRFDYKAGSDKIYLTFKGDYKVEEKAIEQSFASNKVEILQVQRFGRLEENTYEVGLAGLDRDMRRILDGNLGAGTVKDIPQIETVGAKMGKQLRDDAIKSMIYSMLLIMLYVALRFDFRYGPGAIIALFHDSLITIGLFAVAWQEFSLTVIAALLTLIGYSINDTIVVYDRIRENVAKLRDRDFPMVVNKSINETLSRTIMTSFMTILPCIAIWLLGAGVLKQFGLALTFGIFIGTYSSIAIASPITIWLSEKFVAKKAA